MKVVRGSTYFSIYSLSEVPEELSKIYEEALTRASPFVHNMVKISADHSSVTLAYYPKLKTHAHPYLESSMLIDLSSSTPPKVRHESRSNPVILHRLETMIPKNDPRVKQLQKLTWKEEKCGMYSKERTSKIGRLLYWNALCRELGQLESLAPVPEESQLQFSTIGEAADESPTIKREKTAMYIKKPSVPTTYAYEKGYIKSVTYDFGCGRGRDSRWLKKKGIDVVSYDPHFLPKKPPEKVDFAEIRTVLINYVLNVIEDQDERRKILQQLSKLAKKEAVFVISVRSQSEIAEQSAKGCWKVLHDGFVTGKGTFQKGYLADELGELCGKYFEKVELIDMGKRGIVFVGKAG